MSKRTDLLITTESNPALVHMQSVLDTIVHAQSESGGEAAGIVHFEEGGELPDLSLDRLITIAGSFTHNCLGDVIDGQVRIAMIMESLCIRIRITGLMIDLVLSELRRIKRGFLKLTTQNTLSRLQDSCSAKRLFISYLQESIR